MKSRSIAGAAVALALGVTWAFRSVLEFARPNYVEPVSLFDWIAVVSFSVALALLAGAAWLITVLGGGSRPVVASAAVLALGGVVAAVANFVEDGLGISAFGLVFAGGLLGVLAGLVALALVLALRGRYWLAALAAATFVGLFASIEAGGGLLILAAWSLVAVQLWRHPESLVSR